MSSVEFSQLTHYLNKFAEQQASMVRMLARLVELAEAENAARPVETRAPLGMGRYG